ncbi:MAG: hypothetical protein FVQ81_06050 [Candidatus Glassbacteria bacterium]|nr:hypothetical protein [Candidatus Glassbacteria bacterium]
MTRLSSIGMAALLISMTLAGCGDKIDPLIAPPSNGGNGGMTAPTYAQDIKPILDQNCVICHSTANSGAQRNGAPLSVNFDTYDLAVANSGRASIRIQAGTMPPTGALDFELVALFLEWISEGMPRGEI